MDRVPDVPEWLAIDIDHTYFLLQLLLRDIVTGEARSPSVVLRWMTDP